MIQQQNKKQKVVISILLILSVIYTGVNMQKYYGYILRDIYHIDAKLLSYRSSKGTVVVRYSYYTDEGNEIIAEDRKFLLVMHSPLKDVVNIAVLKDEQGKSAVTDFLISNIVVWSIFFLVFTASLVTIFIYELRKRNK